MQSATQLQELLRSVNRKSYPAYKSLKGVYQFQKYILAIDPGTTSTRAVLFDKQANVVEIAQKETTISLIWRQRICPTEWS